MHVKVLVHAYLIWLDTQHQLSKLNGQTITLGACLQWAPCLQHLELGGVANKVNIEAMCLGVVLDSTLMFAPYIRRVSGKNFYHLRQLKIVRRSLFEAAAKTMVYALPSSPAG